MWHTTTVLSCSNSTVLAWQYHGSLNVARINRTDGTWNVTILNPAATPGNGTHLTMIYYPENELKLWYQTVTNDLASYEMTSIDAQYNWSAGDLVATNLTTSSPLVGFTYIPPGTDTYTFYQLLYFQPSGLNISSWERDAQNQTDNTQAFYSPSELTDINPEVITFAANADQKIFMLVYGVLQEYNIEKVGQDAMYDTWSSSGLIPTS